MATSSKGLTNGHVSSTEAPSLPGRFEFIPAAIDVPVQGGDEVEVDLQELPEDPTELCTLLENELVEKKFWIIIALAFAKQKRLEDAIEILQKGLSILTGPRQEERLGMLSALCWMYLRKSREAPRVKPEGQLASEAKTKDFYLQSATSTLNEASRISPAHPPLFLARGTLYLLRASLQPPAKAGPGPHSSERLETLQQAAKCFEDALRASKGKNMMALFGKARAQFSTGRFVEALAGYQSILEGAPDMLDPDPRIGIGSCLWQLGHKEDAKIAWQRALELNADSKVANILMGLYYLNQSSQYPTTDPEFAKVYKKAMTEYTQKAFKLDEKFAITCCTFGGYFLMRKAMAQVERLARRAIEMTDVNAIASDGWYLLARKEHYQNELSKASDCYARADQARGGDDRGYLPAKFGVAQLKVLLQDYDGAKFRLDRIVQTTKNIEAMTLLGTLYAEEVFQASAASVKDDKSAEHRKAISLLESVRMSWKDPKRKISPDASVLLNLARLYEYDHPDKALQSLQQVEQMEVDAIDEEDRPRGSEDQTALTAALREFLPPQLLNNIGCFHYSAGKFVLARELFQTALNACIKVGDKDPSVDTDALVTTLSYNLARTYEAENMLDEAKNVYEGLLDRHSDYVDANIRLAYIALRQDPQGEGPKLVAKLQASGSNDMEVRSLYAWYLHKSKKRTLNIAEDQEQRHYKHTLQNHDKHDRLSLTGMGNLYLTQAREMPRNTDAEKDKRRKTYEKAVEFFDKALSLDPKNAYAAQGIGIALVEDKRDLAGALQIFSKIRDTVKEACVFVNLGHVYTEMKQYSRAIEAYEQALVKSSASDPQTLACLGRVWLLRGRLEKSIPYMKTSLDYSQRALEVAPAQIHFRFNVAFVQIQLASIVYSLPESSRKLKDCEDAAKGLEEAIEAFSAIAKEKVTPFPRGEIEQRANMGRNTMRRQLERAVASQREYDEKNKERLEKAKKAREKEIEERERAKREAEEQRRVEAARVREERRVMQERDRELASQRAEEERLEKEREEDKWTTDEETGERRRKAKKKSGKRKKKGDTSEDEDRTSRDGTSVEPERRKIRVRSTDGEGAEERPRKKKKRLERKTREKVNKYKSQEVVVDSDEDNEVAAAPPTNGATTHQEEKPAETQASLGEGVSEEEDGEEDVARPTKKKSQRVVDDDDDDDDEDEGQPSAGKGAADEDVEMDDAEDMDERPREVMAAGNEAAGTMDGAGDAGVAAS